MKVKHGAGLTYRLVLAAAYGPSRLGAAKLEGPC